MPDLTLLPTLPVAPNSITRPKTFVSDSDATFGALPGLVTAWNTNVPIVNNKHAQTVLAAQDVAEKHAALMAAGLADAAANASAAVAAASVAEAVRQDIQANWQAKLDAAANHELAASASAASAQSDAHAADVARISSESARDSSFANAKGAEAIAAARALVADNETFIVYTSGASTFTAYRRTSSTTEVFLGNYPSASNDTFKATKFSAQVGSQLGGFSDDAGFLNWALFDDGSFGTEKAVVRSGGLDAELGTLVFNEDEFIELTDAFGFVGSKPVAQYMPAAQQQSDGTILNFSDAHGYSAFVAGDTFAASKDAAPAQAAEIRAFTPGPGVIFAAHRGSHLFGNAAPENALDAFVLAARAGFTHVETDLQKTSDGHFVMLHDTTLDRTCRNASDYSKVTGDIAVSSLTLSQLRANYVLTSSIVRYRKPVPTLDEFLQVCKTWALHPIAEIKFTGGSNSDFAALFAKFNNALGPGKYTIADFNSVELDYIRTLSATANLQYLGVVGATTQAQIFSHVATKQPAAVSLSWDLVTADTVALARAAGVDLHVWTVPAADLNTALEFAQSVVVTDQIPPNNYQSTVVHSARGTDAVAITGTVVNDVITLTSGQAAVFTGGRKLVFGAYYCRFWLKGEATVIGASSFSSGATVFSKAISSTDGKYFDFRSLIANDPHNLRIVAGAGGCQISDPSLTVTAFQ